MFFRALYLGFLAVASASVTSFAPSNDTSVPVVIPRSYIVQLKVQTSLSSNILGKRSQDGHSKFHARATGLNYRVRQTFADPSLFYGLSIEVQGNQTDEAIRQSLSSIAGVEKVFAIVKVPRPGITISSRDSTSVFNASTPLTVRAAESLTPPKVSGTSDVSSALQMAGVDKLHALGIKGKGIKIGIVDSGVDYRHPSLGGGFGPGHKIAGGYSYTDDDGNPIFIKDPLATCVLGGHGTHVSGIIGMVDPPSVGFGLIGVAPEASIYMYRVFSCDGAADSDVIMQAMLQAVTDGVDVISMSLGSLDPFEDEDPFSVVTAAIVQQGVAVIVAAGNDGQLGAFSDSSPASGSSVIAVGSVENTQFPLVYKGVDSAGKSFSYASVWPINAPQGMKAFILTGTGSGCSEEEWADAAQSIGGNLAQTVVLFSNNVTECASTTKEALWQTHGFQYIMEYHEPSTDPFASQYVVLEKSDNTTFYTTITSQDANTIMTSYSKAGGYPKYKLKFTSQASSSVPQASGGMMSYFTSQGPTWDSLEMKPQLSAPGAAILSTWPLGPGSGYAILRGTSMATPFITGCYALVKSKFPKLSVNEIRELLQSTSNPVPAIYEKSLLATAIQQGAGLVNPFNAITYTTTVSPSQIQLGDLDDYKGKTFDITISNKWFLPQIYILKHRGAGMVEYLPFGAHPFINNPDPLWSTQPESAVYATVKLSSTIITILPGRSVTIGVTISPPPASQFDPRKVPIISGFISISTLGQQLSVPYSGLPYSRRNAQYIDTQALSISSTQTAPYPILFNQDLIHNKLTFYNGSGIFTVSKQVEINTFGNVFLAFNLLQATTSLRLDCLPGNTSFIPTYYGFDRSLHFTYIPSPDPVSSNVFGTPSYGSIARTLDGIVTPSVIEQEWYHFFVERDDGSLYAPIFGDFRVLLSVLRWGGDESKEGDWETWLSPLIRLTDP